jgi:signal transduction histidine kinase
MRSEASEREALLVVAHEMAGPLQLLALQLGALRAQFTSHETPRLVSMARAIEALRVLARDLLDADRISSGSFDMKLADHDMCTILREVVVGFGEVARQRGVRLSLLTPAQLNACCDALRIAQVLHNLVSNALKFSPEDASIDVQAKRSSNEVLIAITDAGPGIAPENRQRVFEPRWQAPGERRGHGIGLFVARQLVEAHHGRIWVQDAKRGGTTIAFTLPAA